MTETYYASTHLYDLQMKQKRYKLTSHRPYGTEARSSDYRSEDRSHNLSLVLSLSTHSSNRSSNPTVVAGFHFVVGVERMGPGMVTVVGWCTPCTYGTTDPGTINARTSRIDPLNAIALTALQKIPLYGTCVALQCKDCSNPTGFHFVIEVERMGPGMHLRDNRSRDNRRPSCQV